MRECEDARRIDATLRRCDAQTTASHSTLQWRRLVRRNQHLHALASVCWSSRRLQRLLQITPLANSASASSDGGTCPLFCDPRTTCRNIAVAKTTPANVESPKPPPTHRQKREEKRSSQKPSPLAKGRECKRCRTQNHSALVTRVASDTLQLRSSSKVLSHARKAFLCPSYRQSTSISATTIKN